MVKAKKFILVKTSEDLPKPSDFKLVEEELPALKDNEFLVQAEFLSVDPYMRGYMPQIPINSTMVGTQVSRIIESKNPNFPVGKYVVGSFGWTTHTVATSKLTDEFGLELSLLPDIGNLPKSLGIGVLGMPGNTAYFGFLEICQPKAGETVVVTGAGGAVGSIVGQIAKIKGCNVIGIAGSDEKGKWLTQKLGFDHFINYKTQNVEEELKKLAPQGIDCYFDNVGGEVSTVIFNQMKIFGRVSICGYVSGYNDRTPQKVTTIHHAIIVKQLKVEGFIVSRWNDKISESISQNLEWIQQGKLKYRETVTEGFENTVNAFVDMLKGRNIGKAIVKV
ncbi:prostaglandin reductase 1-like [Euwallacea similis]|uniref:prostaglandin reductase 1-like n=1 Tax=Euwallacea similis TaxID=1736056 RepID=UPI00344F0687